MNDEKLLQQVVAKAKSWLGDGYDDDTKAEVKRMLDNPDKTELIESFYKILSLAQAAFAASWALAPTA